MPLLKTAAVLGSCSQGVSPLCSCCSPVHLFRSPLESQLHQSRKRGHRQRSFHENTIHKHPLGASETIPWPDLPDNHGVPNPYQIFNQKKGTPYSKQRFYELVKLYHPDRNGVTPHVHDPRLGCLSDAVKLERYRLIIAANDILSDPLKRSAYDRYGAGWDGRPEVSWSKHDWMGSNGGHGTRGDEWNGHSPFQNATWEDWERWYQRDSEGPQTPIYFSNATFVSLIVVIMALGGLGQVTRAGSYSTSLIEMRDRVHDESSRELNRLRVGTRSHSDKEESIQNFLRMREILGYPLSDSYMERSSSDEVCSSAQISDLSSSKDRKDP